MTYFLSDAHLGSRVIADFEGHQRKIVLLLQQMGKDADAVYMLGDMFDFWYEYIWESFPVHRNNPYGKSKYRPFLQCLKNLTDKGVKVHFFTGNHDIWTFGWLEKETGVMVHRRYEIADIYGKRLFLAHGDGLVPSYYMAALPIDIQRKIRSFIRLRKVFHNSILQFLFRLMPPFAGDSIGYEWARRSRRKELSNPCGYKGENNEELVLFAKEREKDVNLHCDCYIFGHRHIELDLEIDAASADNNSARFRVIVLGDCFRRFSYAQLSPDGNLRLMNLEQ